MVHKHYRRVCEKPTGKHPHPQGILDKNPPSRGLYRNSTYLALLLILLVLFSRTDFIDMGTGIIHTTGISEGSGLTLLGIILTGMAIIHFLRLFLGTEIPLLTTLTTSPITCSA